MSVKIIIDMQDAEIKKARIKNDTSAYVTVPKKFNNKEVLAIPIPATVEPYLDDLLEQDRIILNNVPIYIKTVKEYQKYTHVIYIPHEHAGKEIIIVKKNS